MRVVPRLSELLLNLLLFRTSGIWVTYDLSRDVGDRVLDVLVRCTNCTVPEFVPLDKESMYRIATIKFIANGGDGYDVIANNAQNRYSG